MSNKKTYKKNVPVKEELTETEKLNLLIEDSKKSLVYEAITHFNRQAKRVRLEDDSRFFFNKDEVNFIVSNLKAPDSVGVKEVVNKGKFFCYEIYRTKFIKETRVRKKKTDK